MKEDHIENPANFRASRDAGVFGYMLDEYSRAYNYHQIDHASTI